MAKARDVFRQNLVETERMRAGQETMKEQSEREKADALTAMADRFEVDVRSVVNDVSASSDGMQRSSAALDTKTREASGLANAAAAAAEQASTSVATVAAAAEELAASINEISRQVQHSADIVDKAVAN